MFMVSSRGADVMSQSFAANHTVKMGAMHSIADSLMAPHTEDTAISYAGAISTRW